MTALSLIASFFVGYAIASWRKWRDVQIKTSLIVVEPTTTMSEEGESFIKRTAIERTAVHELGHALCAMTEDREQTQFISVSVANPFRGTTTVSHLPSDSHTWSMLVVALGGIAAEAVVLGSFYTGDAHGDLNIAKRIAIKLAQDGFTKHKLIQLDRSKIDLKSMFTSEVTPEAAELLNAAYRRARFIIRKHESTLKLLTPLLIREKRLDVARILEVLTGTSTKIFSRNECRQRTDRPWGTSQSWLEWSAPQD